jgi:hypothetical protein
MSYTEIYGFDKKGNAYFQGEVKNACRGAMAVWRILEEKYLPAYRPFFVPVHVPDSMIEQFLGYKPIRCSEVFDDNAMKSIWQLVNDNRLKDYEKIVLASTFDYVIIKKENLPKLISAFRKFEGNTSLKEQADIIEEMMNDENCIAVGFNQTSVNGDTWTNIGGYDTETDEHLPYNIFTDNKHWELFEELNKEGE